MGSGQYGDAAAGDAASYAFALAEAERRGNRRLLKKLREIGPPPHDSKKLWTERNVVARLDGAMSPRGWPGLARIALGVRESSIIDLPGVFRAFRFSLDAMWAETSRLDLLELAPALRMPVFFFLGRRDHWVPPGSASPTSRRSTRPRRSSSGSSDPATSRSRTSRSSSTRP